MKPHAFEKREIILWGCVLILLWTGAIVLLFRYHGRLSAQDVSSMASGSAWKAYALMGVLFLLKSVDFVMHCAVLYGASGASFPLAQAIAVNLVGTVIMVTPFYFLGRYAGPTLKNALAKRYPKISVIEQGTPNRKLLQSILLRGTSLPMNVVSLYLGASGLGYGRYLLCSFAGLLPMITVYTLVGDSAADPSSPLFYASVATGIVLPLLSSCGYLLLRHHARR